MTDLRLLSYEDLIEGDDRDLVGLGFSAYTRVLGDTALGTPGPLTIGVFGEWGTGKTSLMRMVERSLSRKKEIVKVWFNAWRFANVEHPIVPLVATIVREMKCNKHALMKLKDGGEVLIKSLQAAADGFSVKSKGKMQSFADVDKSFAAKDIIERSKVPIPDPLLRRSLYYDAFERLSSIPVSGNVRIVVMVDDLDRCFPDLAIRLLEGIKLALSLPGFIFVIGIARNVIERYLQFRYQEVYGMKDAQGQSYIDKLIDLPFHIPSQSGCADSFSGKILDCIAEDFKPQMESVMPIVASVSGCNARTAVRFINDLMIDAAVNRELAEAGEMSELPINYFAVTRCLQLRWPQVFSMLTSADDLCESLAGWGAEDFRVKAWSDDATEARVAAALVGDMGLQALISSSQGKSWLTDHSKRRSAVEFIRSPIGHGNGKSLHS